MADEEDVLEDVPGPEPVEAPSVTEEVPPLQTPEVIDNHAMEVLPFDPDALLNAYLDMEDPPNNDVLESLKAGDRLIAVGNTAANFHRRIGVDEITHITNVIRLHPTFLDALLRIDLSHNNLGDEGVRVLAGLTSAPELQSLNLRNNSISSHGIEVLCASLTSLQLRRLDLSFNPLHKLGGICIANFLQNNKVLYELNVSDCSLDIDALVAISAVLHVTNNTLRTLGLENPSLFSIQEEHTDHIASMLRVNTSIMEIYLGKHRIRDEGVRLLTIALRENKALRVLDLRCNQIGALGAVFLGQLLQDSQLMELNLCANRIGEKKNLDGVKSLAEAIMKNRMLFRINLNHNQLCGEALHIIAKAVDHNTSLEHIALFHNDWDDQAAVTFYDIANDRTRVSPVHTDFMTYEVDNRVCICQAN